MAPCQRCGSTAEAHLCIDDRWLVRPGDDGLAECPKCRRRLSPAVVFEHPHQGAGPLLQQMTAEDWAEDDRLAALEDGDDVYRRAAWA